MAPTTQKKQVELSVAESKEDKKATQERVQKEEIQPGFKSVVERAGIFKYMFFLFELPTVLMANKLIKKGKVLDASTLPGLAIKDRAESIEEVLNADLQEQKRKNPHKEVSLTMAIFRLIRFRIMISTFFECIFFGLRIFSTYCATRMLEYLKSGDTDWAYRWTGILSAVLLTAFFMEHHIFYLKTIAPLNLRAAIVSMIYTKINRLSTYSLTQISLGKIVNIVANDVNVLERSAPFATQSISSLVGIVGGTALLWYYFGPCCLVGIGYCLLSFPVHQMIMRMSVKPRDKLNKITDERVRVTNETIEGIRLLKMYTWELIFRDNINKIRDNEVKQLTKIHDMESLSRGIAFSTQAVASFLIYMVFTLTGGTLNLATVFPSFFLIGFIRQYVVFFFSMALTFFTEAKLLMERISMILNSPEMEETNFEAPLSSENGIEFDKFSASWTKDKEPTDAKVLTVKTENQTEGNELMSEDKYTLKDINVKLKKGSLNALVGKVGAGKSSLLLSFTGEMPKMVGSLRFSGTVAYVEQEPTIFAGTIRENILFGKSYEPEFYKKVISGCNLESDLALFANGDQSEVGEKGVNLSGGQRARLALARAVYADADIYLLDDPLSAVDAKVAKSLYNTAICTLLRGKTVILATHQVHFIKSLESIIVVNDGHVVGHGSYEELKQQYSDLENIFNNEQSKEAQKQLEEEAQKALNTRLEANATAAAAVALANQEDKKKDEKDDGEGVGALVVEEGADSGKVDFKTYLAYLKQAGGIFPMLFMFVVFLSNELATIAYGLILAFWTAGILPQKTCLAAAGGIVAYIIFIYIFKNMAFSHFLIRAATKFHEQMLDRIVKNPTQFFDTNPVGRILNRFSNDIGVMDRFLPATILDVVDMLMLIITLVIALAVIMPWTLIPTGGAAIIIIFVLRGCHESIKQSRKYELVSRSPMYSLFSATLSGLIIIRNYKQGNDFINKFRQNLNNNSKGSVAFWTTSRFFGFYVDLIYNLSGICNIFILVHFTSTPAYTGFGLVLVLSITGLLQYALRQGVQTHVLMSSVRRCQEYCEITPEAPTELPEDTQVKSTKWPQQGDIDLNKVYMRYRANTDYVIRDLSLHANPGEKIGCVGRTGAGKSSIIQLLFRMVEIDKAGPDTASSHITIDGVNTKKLGLHLLRDNISIIPQTPFVFTGTIRKNLDPIGKHSDEELWAALHDVNLKKQVEGLDKKLYTDMTNAASIFSVGQKQLICLARTILKKSKVLVLDEATANVDKQTDDFIQAKIMEKFPDCTIFTIAHRLSTIANYDKVLVLDKGRKVEFDEPYKLLVKNIGDETITNESGHFASMVLNTGIRSSQDILNVARDKYYNKGKVTGVTTVTATGNETGAVTEGIETF